MKSARYMRKRGIRLMTFVLLGAVLALSGCKSTSQRGSNITTSSIDAADNPVSIREMLALRKRWERNKADLKTGLRLAGALRHLKQYAAEVAVLKELVAHHPQNLALRYRYGVELLRANRPVQAEQEFRRLLAAGKRDWQTFNALGSALSEQGRYAEARRQYLLALKASPGNAKVMNNLAMSHILQGNPQEAEKLLKKALPQAHGKLAMRIRQNLALALGLQGRFEEARYMASHDLPPDQVEANMAYLKQMLGSTESWNRIANGKSG